MSWMKISRHLTRILNNDILGQTLIQSIGKFFSRNAGFRIKYRNVSARMYSCIRSTRADHLYFFPRECSQCLIKYAFYRYLTRLNLPAMIIRPIICYY